MENVKIIVEGMSCSHCENAIKKAVGALDGVKNVTVSLADKTVEVEFEGNKVTIEKIKNEIEAQGYDVI